MDEIINIAIFIAFVALAPPLSWWLASKLEARQAQETPDAEHLTPLQRAMLRALEEQPL